MEEQIFEIMQKARKQEELSVVSKMNQKTARFGLSLKADEAKELIEVHHESLKNHRRFEWGTGILEKLIYVFCDSQYLDQHNYLVSLKRLQDIFYKFKNASLDRMSDDEILTFMKEQFETICAGSLEYLEDTCLSIYTEAVRRGYDGYTTNGGSGAYEEFDEVLRWDSELYMQALRELFWE